MPDVAYTKYRLNLPVEDLVREKQAEDAFVASATARGIDAQVARNVIRDQMVASKMVQYELISKWKVTPPRFGHTKTSQGTAARHRRRDCTADIRPCRCRGDRHSC